MKDSEMMHGGLDSASLIEALTQDYECLFHVDFDTLHEDHYRVGKAFIRAIPGWGEETNYPKLIRYPEIRLKRLLFVSFA